jgi:hypothetical protein
MRDTRVLCRWPQWNEFRHQLLAHCNLDEAKAPMLQELELTTEVDSLGLVELIMSLEEAFGVKYVEPNKMPNSLHAGR